MDKTRKDAETFAKVIKQTSLLKTNLHFGNFVLNGKCGVKGKLWWNEESWELIKKKHDYTFKILDGPLEISLQLSKNINDHYKFRAATRINKTEGVVFSVNLTTQKESDNIIYLTNKLKFSEGYEGNEKLAQAHRRQKQILFTSILRKLNFDISDNNDIVLGIFDPNKKAFVNTTKEKFLEDFLIVSIIKGHFMSNKGYELEMLPTFKMDGKIYYSFDENLDNDLPKKIKENKSKRNIPLAFRYKVLKRDKFKCVACGQTVSDGIKLHIDHKTPFSLGGLTELNNLQTLCNECNLSKSNKHIDK